MTGHILTVDGGKGLTSRGQTDWYGIEYMNRKFVQEERSSYANFMMFQKKVGKPPQGRGTAVEDWVEQVQTSKWATRADDAHSKFMSLYSNQLE